MGKVRKSHNKRRTRRRRGGSQLHGAPLSYSLAGSGPSMQSLGQGGQFLQYHQGQHGGAMMGTALDQAHNTLPQNLHGPARLNGLDAAYQQISGLQDGAGRRRRVKSKKAKKGGRRAKVSRKRSKRTKRSKRSKRTKRSKRSRGGNLGFSPFPSKGMYDVDYSRAGLNPEMVSMDGPEMDAAYARSMM